MAMINKTIFFYIERCESKVGKIVTDSNCKPVVFCVKLFDDSTTNNFKKI